MLGFQSVVTPNLGVAIAGVVVSISALVITRGWRAALMALLAHYLFLAGLVSYVAAPNIIWSGRPANSMAVVLPLAGATVTLMLGLTLAQLSGWHLDLRRFLGPRPAKAPAGDGGTPDVPVQQSFFQEYVLRFLSLAIAGIGTYSLAKVYPLVESTPLDITFYWLGITGLLTLIFARDLLKVCLGLLVLLSSVFLLQSISPQAASVLDTIASAATAIVVSLAAGFLLIFVHRRLGSLSLEDLRRG